MRGLLISIAAATALASQGCTVVLPIMAARADVEPDRTPRGDRIFLGAIFGMMIDGLIGATAYGVYRLAKD